MSTSTSTSTQGVLLMATTHPYYGRMAANLANSIKAAAPDMPVAIIADAFGLKHLNAAERGLFAHIIHTDEGGAGLAGANRLRLSLPDLTPFDETIALDVDMLWLNKANPRGLFGLLADRDFTIVNEGFTDLDGGKGSANQHYTHWAEPEAIAEAYGLTGRLYLCRGEFIVFRKSGPVDQLFSDAREVQANPKLEPETLAGSITDEFALNIAMNLNGVRPHRDNWHPAYWPAMHGNRVPPLHKLRDYYALSFGGNDPTQNMVNAYKSIARGAAYHTKVPYRFPLKGKREFLPERLKM